MRGRPPIEEIRGATRQASDNLVNFALEEKVNFVLVAGDLYDGDWQDFETGLNSRVGIFIKQYMGIVCTDAGQ
jgi:hypothetical protein